MNDCLQGYLFFDLTVNVKWSGKNYELEIDVNEPALLFKCQLYDLTGVPPERQKIMIKGGTLKVKFFYNFQG